MAKAFRTEQEISRAQGVSVRTRPTGNITPGGINLNSLSGLTNIISNLTADEDKKRLGEWAAKQRDRISALPNPMDQTREVEKAIKLGTTKFGAVNAGFIEKFLKGAPRSTVRFEAGTGRGVATTGLGQKVEFGFGTGKEGPTAITETNKVILTGMAKFKSHLPRSASVWDSIFNKIISARQKAGMENFGTSATATAAIQISQLMTFAVSSLEKGIIGISALRNTPGWASLGEQGGSYSKQVFEKSVGEVTVALNQFTSGTIMNLLANGRVNGVTPRLLVEGVHTYISEYIVKLQEASAKLGLTARDIMPIIKQLQDLVPQFEKMYDAQFNRRLESARLEAQAINIAVSNANGLAALRVNKEMTDMTGVDLPTWINRIKGLNTLTEVYKLSRTAQTSVKFPGAERNAARIVMNMFANYRMDRVWVPVSKGIITTSLDKFTPAQGQSLRTAVEAMIGNEHQELFEQPLENILTFLNTNAETLAKNNKLRKSEIADMQRRIKEFLGFVKDRTKVAGSDAETRKRNTKATVGWFERWFNQINPGRKRPFSGVFGTKEKEVETGIPPNIKATVK